MAVLINETFTGSNGTQINGFNSWVANVTGLQIQSNKAAKTDDGACYAYKNVSGLNLVGTGSAVFSRYAGTGTRTFNYLVLGSTNVSTSALFLSTGAYFGYIASGGGDPTTVLEVRDGSTIVTSVADANFDANGNEVTVSFSLLANGSGSATFAQSGSGSNTLNWGARTWTNGLGNNHGFVLDWSGTDGAAELTRHQVDNILIENSQTSSGFFSFF